VAGALNLSDLFAAFETIPEFRLLRQLYENTAKHTCTSDRLFTVAHVLLFKQQ